MPAYKLISFKLCPFVQRSVITLEEKGVPYEVEYIDLAAKPDWFVKLSPMGKVPLLLVDDTVLFESAVINEYLDEVTAGSLHPADVLTKAKHRAWIEFGSALLMVGHQLATAKDEETARDRARTVWERLSRLEAEVVGPYFAGETLALVDTAIAPALQQATWLDEIAPSLELLDGLPKVTAWRDALLALPSVKRSLVPDAKGLFVEYLKGRGSPARQVESSWLGREAEARGITGSVAA